MKKYRYRLYYTNINNGSEFFIEVNNANEIMTALQNKSQYARDPDNWECSDSEIIK